MSKNAPSRDDDNNNAVKKGLYLASLDIICNYCSRRGKYIRNEQASIFETVRQWGLHVIEAKIPKRLSAKGVVYVDGNTIAWHEANGEHDDDLLLFTW